MVGARRLHACAIATLLVLIASADASRSLPSPTDGNEQQAVVYQLRIYEIFESNRQAFHDRFRDHAARIMGKYDFKIVAMWESKTDEGLEFVYLLQWPDEQTMKAQWEKFLADQEWSEIKIRTREEHGVLVGEIEDRVLRLTSYSPNRRLLN
jgi:hypothetical protein